MRKRFWLLLVTLLTFATLSEGFADDGDSPRMILSTKCERDWGRESAILKALSEPETPALQRACALSASSSQLHRNLNRKYAEQARKWLHDPDPVLVVASINYLGDSYGPFFEAAGDVLSLLDTKNSGIQEAIIGALEYFRTPLNRDQSEIILSWTKEGSGLDPVARGRAGAVVAVYSNDNESAERGVTVFRQLLAKVAQAATSETSEDKQFLQRNAMGIGGNLQTFSGRTDRLAPAVAEYADIFHSNLEPINRINFANDLGHLPSAGEAGIKLLCEQLRMGDPELAGTAGRALYELGAPPDSCRAASSAPAVFFPDKSAPPEGFELIKEEEYTPLSVENLEEEPCVSFYKEPLGTGCQPADISASLARSAVLRVQFKCPSDRRGYVGWFCSGCKDGDLQSGYSGNYSHTANAHYVHAYEKGTYQFHVICSEQGTAGGFGGKKFGVPVR